jgi:hypothetical protein
MQTQVESGRPAGALSLDDLANLSFGELRELYGRGGVPASLTAVNGDLEGRMLAVRRLGFEPAAGAIRRFAASKRFAWAGKSFQAESDASGRGINRISLPAVLGRQSLFPFATRFDASAVDGKRTIVLDYDRPENPAYIRRIHDEIREVSPGIYLGPAMWKSRSKPTTLLWFALDTGKR